MYSSSILSNPTKKMEASEHYSLVETLFLIYVIFLYYTKLYSNIPNQIKLDIMALDAKQLANLLKLRAIGWSQKDIAEAIGASQQVVAYQLKKLREQSMKEGVDDVFTAALLGGIAGAAGGFALAAMMFEQLTKKE